MSTKVSKPVKGTKNSAIPISEVGRNKRFFNLLKYVALALLLIIPFIGKAVAGKMAMLYLMSDDGKKSGRSSGNVYQKNGRVRRWVNPALRRNIYTSTVRGRLSSFSSAWNSLSDFERSGWLGYSFQKMNRFKQMISVTGKAAFLALNTNAKNVGAFGTVPVVNAPYGAVTPAATVLKGTTISLAGSQFDITLTAVNPDGATCLISATSSMSVGTSNPSQSAFRNIGVGDSTSAPVDIWTAYNDKFGTPTLGARVFVQFKTIDAVTGLVSAVTAVNGIVGA